jgi:hypothetical protein
MSSDLRDAILKKKFIRVFNLYYVLVCFGGKLPPTPTCGLPIDEGMTPRVLDINLSGSCQGRSPLEGYMKPARPSSSTWSRRQKLLVNPNWLHI